MLQVQPGQPAGVAQCHEDGGRADLLRRRQLATGKSSIDLFEPACGPLDCLGHGCTFETNSKTSFLGSRCIASAKLATPRLLTAECCLSTSDPAPALQQAVKLGVSRKRCDATWAATYIFPVLVRSPSHRLAFRTCCIGADARHASCLRRLSCSSIVHKQHRLCCHAADASSLLHRLGASSHTTVGSRCDSQARPSC